MILVGDVRERLAEMPAESVHAVVTSPPYWGLRDYGTDGQLGLEETLAEYLANQVAVFAEVRRVLRKDGTLWLNMGDSYEGSQSSGGDSDKQDSNAGSRHDKGRGVSGLKAKDLIGQPWRLAFALQDDGWWLRSDIIWAKPNPMPESVTDRPTKSHEYVFLLTKSPTYFYDADAVREPAEYGRRDQSGEMRSVAQDGRRRTTGTTSGGDPPAGRNLRDVWTIVTQPYPEAHFATYPEELVKRCVLAGTSARGCCAECGAPWTRETERADRSEAPSQGNYDLPQGVAGSLNKNGQKFEEWRRANPDKTTGWAPTCDHAAAVEPCTVLDPYAGSGTTIAVAQQLGRRGIGIELSAEYAELARRRIAASPVQATLAL